MFIERGQWGRLLLRVIHPPKEQAHVLLFSVQRATGGGEEAAQLGTPYFIQEGKGKGVISCPFSPSPHPS